jgi:hypothetical protein
MPGFYANRPLQPHDRLQTRLDMLRELAADRAREVMAGVLTEVQRRLEELGPGWAVGWRLKPGHPFPRAHGPLEALEPPLEFEFHSVETADGKVSYALDGFHYVRLPEPEA